MKGLDTTQVEQLRQITEYLSYQREQQNISLEKIANQTFIPLRLLKALDSLQFDQLPEPVYIKGFIRRYADAVGLDGTEIADAFPVEPALPIAPDTTESNGVNAVSPVATDQTGRSLEESEQTNRLAHPWLLAGIGAAVLAGAIALGSFLFNRPAAPPQTATAPSELPSEPTTPSPPSPRSTPSPEVTTTVPSPKATAPLTATGSATPVKADVSLTGRSWIQVISDGKTAYEGTLGQGEQRTWEAQKRLVITAGNAGAVVLSCNQGEAKPLGRAGEVVDATCSTTAARPTQTETR